MRCPARPIEARERVRIPDRWRSLLATELNQTHRIPFTRSLAARVVEVGSRCECDDGGRTRETRGRSGAGVCKATSRDAHALSQALLTTATTAQHFLLSLHASDSTCSLPPLQHRPPFAVRRPPSAAVTDVIHYGKRTVSLPLSSPDSFCAGRVNGYTRRTLCLTRSSRRYCADSSLRRIVHVGHAALWPLSVRRPSTGALNRAAALTHVCSTFARRPLLRTALLGIVRSQRTVCASSADGRSQFRTPLS